MRPVLALLALAALVLATATPISHVVIVVEENRAFDNLFGLYPFGCPPIVNNITLSVMRPYGLYDNYSQLERSCAEIPWISVPEVPWAPWLGQRHPRYAGSAVEENPAEGWTQYHGDYWFGKPEGFVFYSGPSPSNTSPINKSGLSGISPRSTSWPTRSSPPSWASRSPTGWPTS
jgi:phospholipase C